MTLTTKLKYRDIICSMMLSGVYTITFVINGEKIRVPVAQLLRDNISGTYASVKGDRVLADVVRRKLMRAFVSTDGLPYGYDCNTNLLLNRADVIFVERDAVNGLTLTMMRSAREERKYLETAMLRKIIQWTTLGKLALEIQHTVSDAKRKAGYMAETLSGTIKNTYGVAHVVNDQIITSQRAFMENALSKNNIKLK